MKIGLIGSQSCGCSTLFAALTGRQEASRLGGKLQLGIAKVLDQRVDRLTELCKPKKTVHAEIVMAMPPHPPTGPVAVTELREMRDLRAYAHVVGAFAGEEIVPTVSAAVTDLSTELVLADLERIEVRQKNIAKAGGARPGEDVLLAKAKETLDAEKPLRLEQWDEQQAGLLDELGLVSQKPVITVVNVTEDLLTQSVPEAVEEAVSAAGSVMMWLCAPLEAEIAGLDQEEQQEFLSAYGLERPVTERFVKAAFDLLDQICFFTVGPDEVRAWPIARQTNARRAARSIHTDLERGFIRAEVITYNDFLQQGSEAACRTAGVFRTEGKDYIVQDGDIINVRFNV